MGTLDAEDLFDLISGALAAHGLLVPSIRSGSNEVSSLIFVSLGIRPK